MPVPKRALPLGQLEWNGVPLTYTRCGPLDTTVTATSAMHLLLAARLRFRLLPSLFDSRSVVCSWPNTGLGYVLEVLDKGAVWASGRTKGPRPHCHVCEGNAKSTVAALCGANVSLSEQPTGDWAAEMVAGPGFGGVSVSGYFSYDWYHESHGIAKVAQSAADTTLQMVDTSRYGFSESLKNKATAPGRFTVSGFLSEVDSPGEYFFDSAAEILYLYPATPVAMADDDARARDLAAIRLGFWHGPGLITMSNSKWVTVRDVAVSGCAGGTVIVISGGENNTVGGCTLRNSRGGVDLISGHGNRVLGNDIYDVGGHISIAADPKSNLQNLKLRTILSRTGLVLSQ
jgi:parallel beta-helix repeat protein